MKPKRLSLDHAGIARSTFIYAGVLAIAAYTLGTATVQAQIQSGTYNSQNGAWNVAGSWTGNNIANGLGQTAFFTNDVTAARTTSLGADRTIGHIVFTDADNSTNNGFNRAIANNILTFDVTSGRSTINVTQANRQLIFDSLLSGDDGLKLIGPGLVRFNNTNNDYSGGTEINAGTLWLAASGTAGSGTIFLGNTTGSDNTEVRLSTSNTIISNDLEVRAGSLGTKTLANRSTNSVTYSGDITVNDHLKILLSGSTGAGVFAISGASNSIATSKTVSFEIDGGGTGRIADSALWSGDGSISYTSSSAKGFTVTGAKTYSGGATLGAMSDTGAVVVQTSSVFTGPTLTSGAFGTGTLTLGATKMRSWTTGDITIGNAITFSDNPTFTTGGTTEKSLIFTGNASLGATRTLTVETGSTVNTAAVEFSGEISGSTFGITKAGAGRLVLSGTNTYDGATTVSVGTLLATKSAALPGYNLASTVSVAGGATLAVRAGESGEWTSTEIDTLLGPTTAAYASGSNIGIDVGPSNSFTYANDIGATQIAKGMVKSGAGTLELTGTHSYTGNTEVLGGTLLINASVSTSINVQTGATLGGSFTTTGSLTVANGGTLSPGNSIGSDTALTASFNSGSTLAVEINSSTQAADLLTLAAVVSNTLTITDGALITLSELGTPGDLALRSRLTLIDYLASGSAGWNGGRFTYGSELLDDGEIFSALGYQFAINYDDTMVGGLTSPFGVGDVSNGGSYVTLTVVPEPRAALLGGLGLLALLRRRR